MSESAPHVRPSPKRDLLVETAWKLFYRDGYRAVGIDTILAEAGVAKMTLYNHFASKEELIVAVLERRHRDFMVSLQSAVDGAPAGTAKVLAVFDWLKEWIESSGFNGCAFIRAVAEYPSAEDKPHRVAAEHKAAVVERLIQLCRDAGLRQPASLGRHLALLIEGAIVTAHTFGAGMVARHAKDAAKHLISAAEP
jgi:AcrR family transcriptional regulator